MAVGINPQGDIVGSGGFRADVLSTRTKAAKSNLIPFLAARRSSMGEVPIEC
jgi:hypothetical protein